MRCLSAQHAITKPRLKQKLGSASWAVPLATLVMASLPVLPVAAQSTTTTSSSSSPVCMVRPLGGGKNVAPQSHGKPFTIIVTSDQAAALTSEGYVQQDCQSGPLATSSEIVSFRNKMCALAHYGNINIYHQFADATGATPDVLCKGAESVAGPWVPPETKH